MACFLAPTTEAIVTTIVKKVIDKKASKNEAVLTDDSKLKVISKKLGWLNKMLWGGSILLCVEHIWHGEVVPFFPFLTAMKTPDGTLAMLQEIGTVGVSMCVAVTAVWGVMVVASELLKKAKRTEVKEKN